MGVYTPDSTTNSVHSLHHYGQCDIDVSQLGLESPTSTSSDIASQNSVEAAVRPPSVVPPTVPSHLQQFSDCSVQQAQNQQSHNLHMAIQSQHMQSMHTAQSPQHQINIPGANNAANQQQQQQAQGQASNRKLSQSSAGSNSGSHRNRSATPKGGASAARNTVTPGPVGVANQQQQQQQQRARVATPVNQLPSPNNQAAMGVQQQQQQQQQLHGGAGHGVLQHSQHQMHLQQMQQFGHLAAPPMLHGHHTTTTHAHHQAAVHHSMQQSNYLPVPPPPHMSGQSYGGAQSPNAFNAMPPSVIQNRAATGNGTPNNLAHANALSTQNPLASPHRMGPSPSSCAVVAAAAASGAPSVSGQSAAAATASNFYMQNNNVGHHAPTPSPSLQQAPTPTPQQMQSTNMNLGGGGGGGNVPNTSAGGGGGATGTGQNPMCSLSKLQQLTNGLEMTQQPCNTPPTVHMNLTPPPNHHPHATMTPPPVSHLAATGQQANPARTLSTPPASALQSQLSYHHAKYYPGNMNVVCSGNPSSPGLSSGGGGSNASRLVRNTPSAPAPSSLNNMGGGIGSGLPPPSGASRTSPNMTALGSNLMPPYGYLNGSRMTAAQQTAASYITNSAAAGFINNAGQLPVQMMNMQGQYQDPRSTQQYGQYYLPLNGSMRR